ncbi:MAG: hypothetical protein ABWY25_09660 [Paenisporosarcina sp.]
MLKRDITYEDFDGETVTESFYFNLTRFEIIDLQVGYEKGLEAALQKIIKSEDHKGVVDMFKHIILAAYGIKSDDGKRFIKNDQVREEFFQTAAYDALFMEILSDEDAAATFIRGIIPKGFEKELEKLEKAEVVSLPEVTKE